VAYRDQARHLAVGVVVRSLPKIRRSAVLLFMTFQVIPLTVQARALRRRVSERVVRWAGWCIETRWTLRLHVARHARLTLLLLRRRGKAWPTLSRSRHDALEEVGRAMTYGGRRWLRWACVRTLSWSAALLQLVSKARNVLLVPADDQFGQSKAQHNGPTCSSSSGGLAPTEPTYGGPCPCCGFDWPLHARDMISFDHTYLNEEA